MPAIIHKEKTRFDKPFSSMNYFDKPQYYKLIIPITEIKTFNASL